MKNITEYHDSIACWGAAGAHYYNTRIHGHCVASNRNAMYCTSAYSTYTILYRSSIVFHLWQLRLCHAIRQVSILLERTPNTYVVTDINNDQHTTAISTCMKHACITYVLPAGARRLCASGW
jgi:hypothetical protein